MNNLVIMPTEKRTVDVYKRQEGELVMIGGKSKVAVRLDMLGLSLIHISASPWHKAAPSVSGI